MRVRIPWVAPFIPTDYSNMKRTLVSITLPTGECITELEFFETREQAVEFVEFFNLGSNSKAEIIGTIDDETGEFSCE